MTDSTQNSLTRYGDGVSDATDAIQTLLDKAGDVYIPSGVYIITHPLIIYSNTRLVLSPNATLKVADHANCSLIDNDGLRSHVRSHDITIIGGRWDGNHEMQDREIISDFEIEFSEEKYIENSLLVLLMRFVHIDRLTLRDMVLVNPVTFGAHIADATEFLIENIHLDYSLTRYNMDGIHIQGPARFGVIRNIYGAGNDDQVALCTEGTARSEITKGIIEDITIDGVYSENGYTGVRLLSCGSALRNVRISNVCGSYRFYAVSFTHHYPLTPDTKVMLENIRVSDLRVSKSEVSSGKMVVNPNGPLVWFAEDIVCRNIVLENIFRHETAPHTKAPLIGIDKNVYINNLRIRNIMQTFEYGNETVAFKNSGDIQNLSVDDTCR